jgi:uncharacterized phosphosugar-binding protein
MTEQALSPGIRYLLEAGRLVDRLLSDEWPSIRAGAELVADALGRGGVVHAFGTGHSHMLAEELFYRAGGLVRVEPILFEGLMLHAGARLSTSLERLPGLADALLEDHPMTSGDVLVVASNSGGNAVGSALAARARELGVRVIAIESVAHATSAGRRHKDVPTLDVLADVVIDNGGCPGDAAVDIEGLATRVAPTSTVTGAAILNAVVAEAVGILVERGTPPEVYTSANIDGGDAANARFGRPEEQA